MDMDTSFLVLATYDRKATGLVPSWRDCQIFQQEFHSWISFCTTSTEHTHEREEIAGVLQGNVFALIRRIPVPRLALGRLID